MSRHYTLPPDNHVHSQWSWDASTGSMEDSCAAAEALGLPSIAFTDHADYTDWALPGAATETSVLRVIDGHADSGFLDPERYWECLDRCRASFPQLRIYSGVELGEPHIFAAEAGGLLKTGDYDRILGSLHSLPLGGVLHYAPNLLTAQSAEAVMRNYLEETLRMVESCALFGILAHIDYPMRAWPKEARPFDVRDFEEEYRSVLRALASSGRALEVNTAGPWPAVDAIRWWYEMGGDAVSFGSDAHEASAVGKGFKEAAAMTEACGFRPGRLHTDFWRR